jgi:protein-S-isoprenylcysteine O-methyltransferase Ste14
MSERAFHDVLLYAWSGAAVVVFAALFAVTVPYGRHSRAARWGPRIGSTAGWLLMEFPAVAALPLLFALGDRRTNAPALVFLALWLAHYGHRSLVYPFLRRGGERSMPLLVALSGLAFNVVNGYLQGRWLFALSPVLPSTWLADPRFLGGAALFLAGRGVNLQADAVLRSLRRPGDAGYAVPRGGLYRWISCPNYLGEIVEWAGWALATWSLAGVSFVVWSFANLAPRAAAHHRWYRATFPDYPRDRKALLPFLW